MDEYMSPEGEPLVPLLAAFEAAANESHVTRAAELLNLPQSTVSRRLQALERAMGVTLFHSAGRGVQLTAQGRDLLARIRTPLRAIDEAVADVKANADPESGLVRFGFPFTLGPVSVPSLLADFHVTAPHIRLRLVQGHAEALTAQLLGGSLDLAIVIPAPLELRSFVLGEQPIALYVSRVHPLAGRSSVDVAELADETFIANPPDYNLRSLLEIWCAEAGFAPRIAFEITEFETMRSLIAHGLGVALLPAPETAHPGLVGIPLGGRALPGKRAGMVGAPLGGSALTGASAGAVGTPPEGADILEPNPNPNPNRNANAMPRGDIARLSRAPSLHTRTIGLVTATTRPTPAAERLRAYLAEHAGRVIAASAR